MKIPRSFPLVFLISTALFAQDTLTYSVQCAYMPVGFAQIYEASPFPSSEFEVGGRLQPAARLSVDLVAGALYVTGYETDSDAATVARPSVYSGMFKAGVMYDLYKGDRSTLGAIFHAGVNYEKTYAVDYGDDGKTSYHLLSPFAFAGFEPSVELTKNMIFFTRLGVKLKYNPPTQSYEWQTGSQPGQGGYELVEKANGSTTIAIEGFCIGIRYQFKSNYFE
jgi:hypothetical protein